MITTKHVYQINGLQMVLNGPIMINDDDSGLLDCLNFYPRGPSLASQEIYSIDGKSMQETRALRESDWVQIRLPQDKVKIELNHAPASFPQSEDLFGGSFTQNAMAPAEDFVVNPRGDVTIAELRCVLRVALRVGHKVWMAI